jgi:hypothetical protein
MTTPRNTPLHTKMLLTEKSLLIDPEGSKTFSNLRACYDVVSGLELEAIKMYLWIYTNLIERFISTGRDDFMTHDLGNNDFFAGFYSKPNNAEALVEHLKTYICTVAASYERIDVLCWAKENDFNMDSDEIVFNASTNLLIDTVIWCVNNDCPYNIQECMTEVRRHERCDEGSIGDRIEYVLTRATY